MPLFCEDLERAFRMFATFDADHNGQISPSELKRALKELGKDLTEDEVSMLILSVGAHSSMGMSFSQFIDFYDKQATLSLSEHPSLEDNLDTFVAMGGRSDGSGVVLGSKVKELLDSCGLKCDALPANKDVSLDFHQQASILSFMRTAEPGAAAPCHSTPSRRTSLPPQFCSLLMTTDFPSAGGGAGGGAGERLGTAASASRPSTNATSATRDAHPRSKIGSALPRADGAVPAQIKRSDSGLSRPRAASTPVQAAAAAAARRGDAQAMQRADTGVSEDAGGGGGGGGAPVRLAWLEELDRKIKRERLASRARQRDCLAGTVSVSNLPPSRARTADVEGRLRGALAATTSPQRSESRSAAGSRARRVAAAARDGERPAWMP